MKTFKIIIGIWIIICFFLCLIYVVKDMTNYAIFYGVCCLFSQQTFHNLNDD